MKYHIISATLIAAAIALQMAGYGNVGTNLGVTLFTASAACEFWFWIRLGLAKKSRLHNAAAN